MKPYIYVSVYCPRALVERMVICHQFGGYYCKGCEDADESEICKRCISNVEEKLSPEDFL